ncbi:MAG: hypothetical protein NC335_05765, partial [Bacteroides sp.]|nr:hypothetical protein [Bacteroides sp.]
MQDIAKKCMILLLGYIALFLSTLPFLSKIHALPDMKKALITVIYIDYQGFIFGGADGTRTRDPRRDRPVF